VIYFPGFIPGIHHHENEELKKEEHPSLFDLGDIGDKKRYFNGAKNGKDGYPQPRIPLFYVEKKITEQDGCHHHGYGNGKTISRFHVSRVLKIQYHHHTSHPQNSVYTWNIDLAF